MFDVCLKLVIVNKKKKKMFNNFSNESISNFTTNKCEIFQTLETIQDFLVCYSYFFKKNITTALLEIVSY
jgi:hypothetical protein